jgi:DNA polymerase eta
MAAKSLPVPISNIAGMERWYKILSIELRSRILQNFEEYGSWPKSVSVIYH